MFRDRQDVALQLAARLRSRLLHDPLVLAIPRGGVVLGATLARALHADLDVVLSRKLRCPWAPEAALGALGEDGTVYLDPMTRRWCDGLQDYLEEERRFQAAEITRRQKLFRTARPRAPVAGRSVIVTDDGIATGSTMIAALEVLRGGKPRERIIAVPVIAPDRIDAVRHVCDELIYLAAPEDFSAIGTYYRDFRQLEDDDVVELLRAVASEEPGPTRRSRPAEQRSGK